MPTPCPLPVAIVSVRPSVTRLLQESRPGDASVLDAVVPLVYEELRQVAHRQLSRERAAHTLNTTALVHETYLQLVDQTRVDWRDRAHFFAIASTVMRRVLIDYARGRGARKRGGERVQVPLRPETASVPAEVVDLLVLDEALTRLAEHDERMARVVEHRFFGGMTAEETAEALGCSLRTVERLWTRAKLHLYQLLRPE